MGLPMAKRLHLAGFKVSGFDIRAITAEEAGSLPLCHASALCECEVLISVVRDVKETQDLCFATQNVYGTKRFPPILVVCSTLPPSYLHDLSQDLPASVTLIDAPMSGAPAAARAGDLTFMLGGERDCLDRLEPLFSAMGSQIVRAGEMGAGMTLKVLNNYVAASSVVAVRRVLQAAGNVGIEPSFLREVMSKSSGSTWFGNQFEKIDWAEEGYSVSNTIGILEKDVECALDVMLAKENAEHRDEFDCALLSALKRL